jgi:hypothetical protein
MQPAPSAERPQLVRLEMAMPQNSTQQSRKPDAKRNAAPQPVADVSATETEDQVYGLVSVLYHALQGAQACEQYIDDADRAGDDELSQFFQQCREEQNERGKRAKQLLAARVEDEEDDDDDDDDDDDETSASP